MNESCRSYTVTRDEGTDKITIWFSRHEPSKIDGVWFYSGSENTKSLTILCSQFKSLFGGDTIPRGEKRVIHIKSVLLETLQ